MIVCRVEVKVTDAEGNHAGFCFNMRGVSVKTIATLLRSVLSCYIR